jgi:acyl dehydratase
VTVPQDLTLEGVAPGMEMGEVVFGPLTRADIARYAGASGDFNPIHIDEDYARSTGAPTVFAMGMLPAGYVGHALSDWFGGPHRLRRYKVRFTTRVWPGDELVCSATVVAQDDGIVKVALEARRRGQGPAELELPVEEIALVGEADVELPG